MLILPAIDLYDGRCVRLTKGKFSTRKEYKILPGEMAALFADKGFEQLHVVDLEGAENGAIRNWDSIGSILSESRLKIQIGGGIRTADDIDKLLALGAERIIIGSLASDSLDVTKKLLVEYGKERIVIAADFKDDSILHAGWKKGADMTPLFFIESLHKMGFEYFLSTDISKDGVLKGPNTEFYESILKKLPDLKLIASGGVSSLDDLIRLKRLDLYGAIVGKAIYENLISLEELVKI